MMINIYGGNNLIAPVASSAIQNFYGDRGDEAADQPEDSEKRRIQKVWRMRSRHRNRRNCRMMNLRIGLYTRYKGDEGLQDTLGECTTARELAVVVGKMLADENCRNVDKHTVVKAAFIKSLLPLPNDSCRAVR